MQQLSALQIKSKNSAACFGLNAWSKTQNQGEIISINPTTEQAIASVYRASMTDYEEIVKNAQTAFAIWRNIPAPKRGEIIHAIGEKLRQKKDYLGSLVSLEMGKSKQEGDGEVQEMIDMADFAVGQSRMLYGKTMHSERPSHRMYEQWQPLGLVGIITAFNFPVAVWAWNAFIAAICGNISIWKPSPKTPLCAIAVQHICNEVMAESGYPQIFYLIISDENNIVTAMTKDPKITLLSFTGSTTVGQHLATQLGQRLAKGLFELSGNNAIIVDDTADLALALPAIVFGAVGTAGQRCTTTRRLFLQESIYDKLLPTLISAYRKIKVGDPLDPKNFMGPLIDHQAVLQFQKAIELATQQGGKILFGGKKLVGSGFFVEPTLIAAENHWEIVQCETFGPILYVMKFKTIAEAIELQNQSAFGLSSALFTKNIHHAEMFLSTKGSDCGIANINIGTSGAEIGGAFGGEKNTGGGREAGSDAWKSYMRRQTTTINWGESLTLAQGIQFEI